MIAPPAERAGHPAPPDTLAAREAVAAAAASGVWATEPPPEERMIGGVRCLVFGAEATRGTLLHAHGGAFRLGRPEQVSRFAAALSARCAIRVVCPAYRLAPEHPFPAGLNDCRAVMTALAAEGVGPLLLSGDSAGGGLAASLALLSRDDPAPPIGMALLSAWLDLRATAASYAGNAGSDPLFSLRSAVEAAALYLQGHDPADPLASPLLAPGASFPPAFVSVGAGEVLLDDSRAMHDRLRDAAVESTLDVVPGMEHVAVTRGFALTGAERTFEALVAFVTARLDAYAAGPSGRAPEPRPA